MPKKSFQERGIEFIEQSSNEEAGLYALAVLAATSSDPSDPFSRWIVASYAKAYPERARRLIVMISDALDAAGK